MLKHHVRTGLSETSLLYTLYAVRSRQHWATVTHIRAANRYGARRRDG